MLIILIVLNLTILPARRVVFEGVPIRGAEWLNHFSVEYQSRLRNVAVPASVRIQSFPNDLQKLYWSSVAPQIFSDPEAFGSLDRQDAAKRRPVSNTTIAAQFLDLSTESWSPFDRLPTISGLRRRWFVNCLAARKATTYYCNAIVSAFSGTENFVQQSPLITSVSSPNH